jgi:hypothetical protein
MRKIVTFISLGIVVATLLVDCNAGVAGDEAKFERKIQGSWDAEKAPNRLLSRLIVTKEDKGFWVEVWATRGLKDEMVQKAPLHLLRAGIGEKGPVERGLATWKEGAGDGEATLYATFKFNAGDLVLELSKVYREPKNVNWFTSFALKKSAAAFGPKGKIIDPDSKPVTKTKAGDMTDEQMLKRVVEVISREDAKATITPIQSKNLHLGTWLLKSPLPEYRFFCARLNTGKELSVPNRRFLAVKRTGEVIDSFDGTKFTQLLASADKAKWKDEDHRNAAMLWVHVMSRANEDGWAVLAKPDDFTKITFNMDSVGLGGAKQKEASKQIIPLKIERKDGQAVITFYAWHLIGGNLRRWQVEIGPKMAATKQELGQFGGGGYD